MRRPKRFYILKTSRSFTECNGKYSFRLWGKKSILPLLQKFKKEWKVASLYNGKVRAVMPCAGVYAIAIHDTKNKTKEIGYVGSSKNLALRMYAHDVISFLHHKLSDSCQMSIYVCYDDNFKELEKEMIFQFRPFLNVNVETPNHFIHY